MRTEARTNMEDPKDDQRMKYGQFVELLNTIRSEGLITAEKRRELDKRWRTTPQNRDLVLEEMERIMETHSEKLISNNE